MFDLHRFLKEQDLSPEELASLLRVSDHYIRSVLAGTERLAARDEAACAAWALRRREQPGAVSRELTFLHSLERYMSASRERGTWSAPATPASEMES